MGARIGIWVAMLALLFPASAEAGKETINLSAAADEEILVAESVRRVPGQPAPEPAPTPAEASDPDAVPPPPANLPGEFIPIPDRWRLVEAIGVSARWWDPYNQNVFKGDRPIADPDWFISLAAISDTVIEPRRIPTPIADQASRRPGSLDQFGNGEQLLFNQNLILSASLIKGDTAYRPPDLEVRFTPVINFNYTGVEEVGVLKRDPRDGTSRKDYHIGVQEAFVDYHIRNVSDRYDFDSIRFGIQPFSTDFRGFLFQDNQLGIRLFGNRDNNIFQYNLAWFRRLEKDTNSGLNDVLRRIRDDDIFIANLYIQDLPMLGFVSQFTVVHNRNREDDRFFFNDNDFIERPASFGDERPRKYDVTYIGFNGDGHFGRANLTVSAYYAFGTDEHNQLNDSLFEEDSDIRAYFLAAEPSVDFDWIRLRGSFLFASGDDDPFDNTEKGFDAIFENPQFAGGDTSFWVRQGIPFIGGGGVALTQRNGVLASLRTSKEHGQSNFNNPGILLVGLGADFDIRPDLRLSTNFNYLRFAETEVLQTLRNQGTIDKEIGYDLSTALIYRPFDNQNLVLRLSGAALYAGDGLREIYASEADPSGLDKNILYSVLGNVIVAY